MNELTMVEDKIDTDIKKPFCGPHRIVWTYQVIRQITFIANDVIIMLLLNKQQIWNYSYIFIYICDFFIFFINLTYYVYKFHYFVTYEILKKTLLLTSLILFSLWKFFNILYLNLTVAYFIYYQLSNIDNQTNTANLYLFIGLLINITLNASFWFQFKQVFDASQQCFSCIFALKVKHDNKKKAKLNQQQDPVQYQQKYDLLQKMKQQLKQQQNYQDQEAQQYEDLISID